MKYEIVKYKEGKIDTQLFAHPAKFSYPLRLQFSLYRHGSSRSFSLPWTHNGVMDPDMDIPLPEELELLEANSHFDDEYLDYPSPQPFPSPPHSPADSPSTNRNKRPRSDDETDQEKRSKVLHNDEEVKGDLLHYSPEPCAPLLEDSGGVAEKEVQEKFVSRYASEIDGDFIPVTAPSGGHRVYAKICRVEGVERGKRLDVKQSNGLITEPFNVLLQSMEQEAFTKALQASSGEQSVAIHPKMEGVHEKLWVDKYAPNSFTELLSDEQTNREVLLWLKQWDSCVYGSEVRSTGDKVLSALRRHTSVAQHQKPSDSTSTGKNQGHRWSSGNFRRSSYFDNENSKSRGSEELGSMKSRLSGPPEQKILLLCGPPGLGKTTLAHVAAKHCGYRVVEVNASDDRSSSTIEAKILDVVEMNSVTADSRPKCLVIDEIDGALGDGKGAVDVILKMVSAEGKSDIGKENAAKGEQSGRTTLKKRRKTASLLRPVICVCNDLYAPALRPLRQVAKVHIFVQPTVSRVVSRLKYICNKEGMRAGSIALTALAEYTECDIRSCLNTLQFLNKKKKDLNVLEISSQVVGQKNMSKSVYEIWKEIFQKRKTKQERTPNTCCGRTSNEFDLLYSLLSNRGDYDIVLDGIHENILHLYYHDPVMEKTVKCFNILAISDLMHQYMWRTLQLPLQAYQPFLAISVHRLVSQVKKPNIEWPKSYQRFRTSMIEKVDVLRSWQNKILPYISRHLSIKSFVEDSISPLLHILSPPSLRPVALHLLTEKEKDDLAQLVSVMVSYFITYKNIKPALPGNQGPETAIDASTFSFDPPICDFISFKDYSSGHYVLPLAVKQVLVHEVEKQRILRVTRSVNFMDRENQENVSLVEGKYSGAQYSKINSGAAFASDMKNGKDVSNSRHILASGSVVSSSDDGGSSLSNAKLKSPGSSKKSSTGYRNFFARFRKVGTEGLHNADAAVQKITVSDRDSRPLLFKFNEGFTNAVKRPVRMREFLL